MQVTNLEDVSLGQLARAFNAAFENYFVKVHYTEESLGEKLLVESIEPSLSAAVFDGELLVAFILTGVRTVGSKLTAYNAGTGVLPEYRGRHLVKRMYEYLIPLWKAGDIQRSVLEVIVENQPAISAYKQVGYSISRTLDCYKAGDVNPDARDVMWRFSERLESSLLSSFCDVEPTWQHSPETIDKTASVKVIETTDAGRVTGFVVFKPANGRVYLAGVSRPHRRQGIGTAMFALAAQHSGQPLSCINVDSRDIGIGLFLQKIGMEKFITQYGMETSL